VEKGKVNIPKTGYSHRDPIALKGTSLGVEVSILLKKDIVVYFTFTGETEEKRGNVGALQEEELIKGGNGTKSTTMI